MQDRIVKLKNNVQVGVIEFGDLDSDNIVFYLHGFPGCRCEPLFAEKHAVENRVKIIGVDRIGYGNTTYIKGMAIADYGEIFKELVDALGIDKFKIIGVSGGSPYLASVCATLKDRVKQAVVVSGLSPIDKEEVFKGMSFANKFFLKLGRKALSFSLFWVGIIANIWRLYPDIMIVWLKIFMSKKDKQYLSLKYNNKYLKSNLNEAVKNGVGGIKNDYVNYCKPWGVDFSKIDVPVAVFHGTNDPYVPYEMGKYLSLLYKNSKLYDIKGEGHLAVISSIKQVLDTLC